MQKTAYELRISDWSSDVCSSDFTFQFTGALEGEFQFADRYFYWDAGYTYAKNKANNKTDGLFNVLALRQALGPSMLVNGTPTCVSTPGDADSAIDGCVPLNLLGADGSITRSEEHTSELQSLMRTTYAVFCLNTKPQANK